MRPDSREDRDLLPERRLDIWAVAKVLFECKRLQCYTCSFLPAFPLTRAKDLVKAL